jgi:hypothetical protein
MEILKGEVISRDLYNFDFYLVHSSHPPPEQHAPRPSVSIRESQSPTSVRVIRFLRAVLIIAVVADQGTHSTLTLAPLGLIVLSRFDLSTFALHMDLITTQRFASTTRLM